MKQVPIGTKAGLFVEEINNESLIPSWLKKLCQRVDELAFLVGFRFVITIQLTNIGNRYFRGGQIFVPVKWQSGRIDYWRKEVPPLNIDEICESISLNFGVLEPWFGIIHIECQEYSRASTSPRSFSPNKPMMFTSDKYHSQSDLQFSSVFGQLKTEYYTFWALLIAVVGLLYPLIKDIFLLLCN